MKQTLFILVIVIATQFTTQAQNKGPIMSFDNLEHNYGNISQENGDAFYTFTFTNTGTKPIVLNDVDPSCGCTTPIWNQTPVKPGEKGTIEVGYETFNSPGYFSKTITVTSNAKNSPIILTITGNVLEKQNDIDEKYPQKVGDLRLDQIMINFGNIFTNETERKMELKIYNPTESDLKVNINDKDKPNYLKTNIIPQNLKPGESGVIEVYFDASKANQWDYVSGYMYITLNGIKILNPLIQTSAIVKEKFTPEQILHQPKIEFEDTKFKFDTIVEGEIVEHVFKYTNTGETDLVIRQTRASCGCTAISLSKENVKPGESGTIKATFNSSHKINYQIKTITVITNCPDPKYNKLNLELSGFVKQKK
ncbi:MAG: DUF1573 domain-containing protein [Bacteroidales bacterium]|nr:DUF1573 domain-containing protein [Bacteroidales bacterium]